MHEISLWLESIGVPPLLGGLIAGAVLAWIFSRLRARDKSAVVLGTESRSGTNTDYSNRRNSELGTTERDADHSEAQKKDPHDLTDLELAVIFRHMQKGEKITAIKLVRERTGMGLAEAKRFVEELDESGIGH
ncbi:MAG: ribosomal protein L7/L12 [Sulfuritalea sp.]|nr:ribosomal protein L7/L12 [Sulfuritalea sp.]